jgi:cytochrome c2
MRRKHHTSLLLALFAGIAFAVTAFAPTAQSQKAKTKLPAEVEAILADKPCYTCHSMAELGGGKLGPNLETVGERRDAKWLRTWLTNPRGVKQDTMMPGGLLEGDEVDTMVTFLASLDAKVNVEAIFDSNKTDESAGKALFGAYDCGECHQVRGAGGNLANTGPDLKGVGKKYDTKYLRTWLSNPAKVKEGTFMPSYDLTEREVKALVAYLESL